MDSFGDLLSAVGSTRQHHSSLSAKNIGFLNVTSGRVLPCLSYWIWDALASYVLPNLSASSREKPGPWLRRFFWKLKSLQLAMTSPASVRLE